MQEARNQQQSMSVTDIIEEIMAKLLVEYSAVNHFSLYEEETEEN